MKLSINLICLLLFNFCFSQTKNFIYEYTSIPDSTQPKDVVKELVILSISKNKSEFYSLDQFKNDSIVEVSVSKGFPPPPQKLTNDSYRIIKEIPNNNKISFIAPISSTTYHVSEEMDFQWKLVQEFQTIMNYKAQKATTSYGGRNWIAWFTNEVPIQDGPYKFSNLPGLILKIEDEKQNHIFEIKAIYQSTKDFIYPQNKYVSYVNVNHPKFVEIFRNYRKYPISDIVDRIQDVKDSNGYIVRSKSQIIKQIEDATFKRLKKDNNIIEINLLK